MVKYNVKVFEKEIKMIRLDNIKIELPALADILREVGDSL